MLRTLSCMWGIPSEFVLRYGKVMKALHLTWGVVVSQNVRRIFRQVSTVLLECCIIIGRPCHCFSISSSCAGFFEKCSAKLWPSAFLDVGAPLRGCFLSLDAFQNWMQFFSQIGIIFWYSNSACAFCKCFCVELCRCLFGLEAVEYCVACMLHCVGVCNPAIPL